MRWLAVIAWLCFSGMAVWSLCEVRRLGRQQQNLVQFIRDDYQRLKCLEEYRNSQFAGVDARLARMEESRGVAR